MNTSVSNEKPGMLTAIAAMTLTSGILNLFWGFVASATAVSTIVGVVCLPITILPTILGIFEIIYAAKLLSNQPQPVQASPSLAVLQALTFFYGNIFSMVVGILNLIFFNDQSVKAFFARINGLQIFTPVPAASSTPDLPATPASAGLPEPSTEEPREPLAGRKVAGE